MPTYTNLDELTEDERVQTLIGHVLVNQHPLVSMDAASQQPHKIPVLQFSNQDHFILQLCEALSRLFRQSFNCYLFPICEDTLLIQKFSLSNHRMTS